MNWISKEQSRRRQHNLSIINSIWHSPQRSSTADAAAVLPQVYPKTCSPTMKHTTSKKRKRKGRIEILGIWNRTIWYEFEFSLIGWSHMAFSSADVAAPWWCRSCDISLRFFRFYSTLRSWFYFIFLKYFCLVEKSWKNNP